MAQVILNLQDKGDAEVLNLGQTHIEAMTDNPNFTTPDPLAPAFLLRVNAFG